MFTRSEPMQLYLWGVLKDMVYINNPSTENGKAVQGGKAFRTLGLHINHQNVDMQRTFC